MDRFTKSPVTVLYLSVSAEDLSLVF